MKKVRNSDSERPIDNSDPFPKALLTEELGHPGSRGSVCRLPAQRSVSTNCPHRQPKLANRQQGEKVSLPADAGKAYPHCRVPRRSGQRLTLLTTVLLPLTKYQSTWRRTSAGRDRLCRVLTGPTACFNQLITAHFGKRDKRRPASARRLNPANSPPPAPA